MNPYREYVCRFAELLTAGRDYPLGGFRPLPKPKRTANSPVALIFSPHPDDECVMGGLALRLATEAGFRIANVAVTQGSRKDRQHPRLVELTAACDYLGIGLITTGENGLQNVNMGGRENADEWQQKVDIIATILDENQPQVIFFPHQADWNSTHIGTHHLVVDALKSLPSMNCTTIETEFWGAMDDPNLMVSLSNEHVEHLITALSFHVGEVERNPYHLTLPAWLIDNVRRGGELVGGQGGAVPNMTYATLYRLRHWRNGQWQDAFNGGRFVDLNDDIGQLCRAP